MAPRPHEVAANDEWVGDPLGPLPCAVLGQLEDPHGRPVAERKVKRNEASDASAAFEDALARLEIKVAAEQVAKTQQVLEFFADRLP